MTKHNSNWVTERLRKSPWVALVVAGFAVLGFLLSLANGGWTIYKEIEAHRKSPAIKLFSQSLFPLKAEMPLALIFGNLMPPIVFGDPLLSESQKDSKKKSSIYGNVDSYYYRIGLAALNPRNESSSILECKLDVEFDKKHFVSITYFYEDDILNKDSAATPSPVIHLAPNEVRKINFLFFFFPTTEVEKVLSAGRVADSFFISCRDQDARVLSTMPTISKELRTLRASPR